MKKIIKGDCLDLIKEQPDNSVDLIITSPPYADIVNYGKKVTTNKPDDYCDWLIPLFVEIHRVLKPSGSFIMNINDKCVKGYRSTYIYDLISRNNKETKLKLYDTYIWHKRNGIPNGGPRRFRNTTEFIFHFCKDQKYMKFNMDRVLQEPKESYSNRFNYDTPSLHGEIIDGVRVKEEKVNTDIPKKVRPDNVVRFSTAGASRDNLIKHPAPYHKELPLYYINILTDEGDLVLDPFSGIATTGMACKELNRDYIGYELNEDYADFSIKRLNGEEGDTYVINQYTMDDVFIKSFSGKTSAAKELGLSADDIFRCCSRNNRSSTGGFKFKLEKKD